MHYRSNGKLLISGEYLVLKGAQSLAVPTKFGQELMVEKGVSAISWQTFIKGELVLTAEFDFTGKLISSEGDYPTKLIADIFQSIVYQRGVNFLKDQGPLHFRSDIEFPANWGLGSSSTLINNLALWSQTDPYQILSEALGGSGYDIACASSGKPIIYFLEKEGPFWMTVDFNPPFHNNLFFIHLNRKEQSRQAVEAFVKSDAVEFKKEIEEISVITSALCEADRIETFSELLGRHEQIMSAVLKRPTVKEERFSDYPHIVKSLGAWGGDFVLAAGEKSDMEYFRSKGFDTIIPWNEMVLTGGNKN